MSAYYNEHDKFAAAWLRELIKHGHIADGVVDERSIEDVAPNELREFKQCHFFAGIGGWSYALRRAGWADDRPVWTGSCPCQPFSAAGKGSGFADERHLWPAFFHLICECEPGVVYGEQVASKDGLAWFDLVSADLESADYTGWVADLCAAGVGAPHIRQRLFFVADSEVSRGRAGFRDSEPAEQRRHVAADNGATGELADHHQDRCLPDAGRELHSEEHHAQSRRGLGNTTAGRQRESGGASRESGRPAQSNAANGHWHAADWLPCIDGKARPVEPGTFPLAHGATNRVGRLRGYGNAINVEVAAEFITAYMRHQSGEDLT